MIKALIIDDEVKARNLLYHYMVNFCNEITEIKQAASADEATELLQNFKADILFLDVEMPHKNGFDFLLEAKSPDFDIVFTTAYNQYAIQAIRFSALDYLLKPIDPDELKAAVARHIEKKFGNQQKNELYNNLAQNIKKKEVKDFRIAVPTNDGVYFFTIDEVIHMEANTNYTYIHLQNKKPFIASKTLKHFEEMLEGFDFIRTHKSHLVNRRHITQLTSDHDFLVLSNGNQIEISRRRKEEVLEMLKK